MERSTETNLEKIDLSGSGAPEAKPGHADDIISNFNEIIGKHLDRLMGARQGIEALPMNIFTVSCLILLATRETEIEGFPYLPPERYTQETLLKDMSEMNIEHGGDLESYVKSMLEKGYIRVENDGRLFPGQPIIKIATLFDRIFPKMPGLNFVAYLGQMIDEVLSSRKPLDMALNQFDQMLNLQGVSLVKDNDSVSRETGRAFPHLKVSESAQPVKKKIVVTDIKPSDIYSKLQTKNLTVSQYNADSPISSFDHRSEEVGNVASPDFLIRDNALSISGADVEADIKEKMQQIEEPEIDVEPGKGVVFEDDEGLDKSAPIQGYDQDFLAVPEDDDIEKKIAAFEEELSMTCPLCRMARIVPSTTAKGKHYYKCSNEECNFISWGKPYYLSCPRCENPFLIEYPDSQGKMILKCPKTTCPHWQKFPWDEEVKDIKVIAPESPGDTAKKPRRLVRRRKRVLVRKKS